MKVFDILIFAEPIIKKLLEANVNPKDVQYLELFSEYQRLSAEGHKTTYIEAILCEEFDIKKTKFYEIIKSFGSQI